MPHHIYRSEGIVLGGRESGEGSKILFLLTEHLGLVPVLAQGVRELRSKLRYVTQHFSYARFELVRGKEIWRLTNAEEVEPLYVLLPSDAKALAVRIALLVRRLFQGEEPNPDLFRAVRDGFLFLRNIKSPSEMRCIEIVLVLKILNTLGYGGGEYAHVPFNKKLESVIVPQRARLLKAINRFLKETHL